MLKVVRGKNDYSLVLTVGAVITLMAGVIIDI
jgi:hypothetical protein